MQLSAPNLEIARTQPQRTALNLAIFEPQTIMKCRLNNPSAAKGDRIIPYDGVSLGNFSSVESNFTLLVGSTDGARDIGKIRVKSATASQFVVSENSNISFVDNAFLTVLRYVELNPIYPRIIPNPADDEDVIFLKDWDDAYTNQNSILGSFVCAGSHQGLFRGEQVYYSSTGTVNLVGSSLTYDWAFEGGTPTGSTSATPGNVTYNTPGDYVTRLRVTAANGAVDTTYRYIAVRDRLGQGDNPPVQTWAVTSLGGSRDSGGYTASFRVHEDVSITENAVVVLFAEDWYGSTKQSFSASQPNNGRIFFVGHILDGTIRQDWQHSYVEFSVGSITEVMKQALGFSISVESKASPSKWYELLDMDCRRAVYHYLRYHTTAMQIADFQFLGNDQKIQFFDTDRASMFDAIDNLMRNTLVGKVVADRQGKMWAEQDAKSYPSPTSSFPSVMEITRRDWASEPSIEERPSDRLSYLEMGGIAYSGVSTGTYSAHLACAPGNAPSFRGRIETPHGLAIAGSAQLVRMAGNVWANENSKYPRIGMGLAINARHLDIAPQETVQMNILAGDTVRGVAVDGLYVPAGMNWSYNPQGQILLPSVDFENLVDGVDGEAINIPTSAEVEGGFSVPSLQIPAIPAFTIPPFSLPSSPTTGSSCCNYIWDFLGLGGGAYDLVLFNPEIPAISVPTGSPYTAPFTYASNLSMYNPSTREITIRASGTYNVYMYGEWWLSGDIYNTNTWLQMQKNSAGLLSAEIISQVNSDGEFPFQGCDGNCPNTPNAENDYCEGCHGADHNTSDGTDFAFAVGDVLTVKVLVSPTSWHADIFRNVRIVIRKIS